MLTAETPQAEAADPAALLRALRSRKTGVITRLLVSPRTEDQVPLTHLMSTLADLGALPAGGRIARPCGGQYTLAAGVRQVVLEIVERYCAAFVDYGSLLRARPTPEGPFLFGERLPLYAESQYDQPGWPFRRLTSRSMICWAHGRSLVTGRTWYVPAPLVFIPYKTLGEDEWLGPSTSTGMACDWSWTRACLAGLWEVCERDAFAILWMNRVSRPRLRVDPRSVAGRELGALLEGRSASATFVDMTNDLRIPAVLAVLESRVRGERVVTVGGAARARYVEAARKALIEAVADAVRIRDLLERPGPRWAPAPAFANVTDWEWHSLVYQHPEHQGALDFLTASPEEREMPTGAPVDPELGGDDAALLLESVRRVAAAGEEVIAVGLTTRDVAALGLHAVKVFVPGAVPLNPDHRRPPLGHPRLYSACQRLGWRAAAPRPEELNPMPHPFA